jgi:hypothetical protein
VYHCDEGFNPSGSHVCSAAGSFEGGGCTSVDCGYTIRDLDPHATAACTGDTRFGGDTCLATCAEGLRGDRMHFSAEFRCSKAGSWEGDLICVAQRCSLGLIIEHSDTQCSGVLGDHCRFTCSAGYECASCDRVCGSTGSFMGDTCTPASCTSGLTIAHSNKNNRRNGCVGRTGDVCDYHCNRGFAKTGDHICGAYGAFAGGGCARASDCDATVRRKCLKSFDYAVLAADHTCNGGGCRTQDGAEAGCIVWGGHLASFVSTVETHAWIAQAASTGAGDARSVACTTCSLRYFIASTRISMLARRSRSIC